MLKADYTQHDYSDVFYFDTSRPEPELHSFKQIETYGHPAYGIHLWRRKSKE